MTNSQKWQQLEFDFKAKINQESAQKRIKHIQDNNINQKEASNDKKRKTG